MTLFERFKNFFKTEGTELPAHDPVGPVMSQMYDDILVHREELARDDRGDYKEFAAQALFNLDQMAPDEASKRAVLVIVAESLKK